MALIRLLIVVVTIAACCLIAVRIRFSPENVMLDKLERIKPGMTVEDVAAVMAGYSCTANDFLNVRFEEWRIGDNHRISVFYANGEDGQCRVGYALRCRNSIRTGTIVSP